MQIDTNGIELGDHVRDTVTRLEGTVTAVHQYVTGCARVSIQPPAVDGKVPDQYGADVLTVEIIQRGPRHEIAATAGGPRLDPAARVREPGR